MKERIKHFIILLFQQNFQINNIYNHISLDRNNTEEFLIEKHLNENILKQLSFKFFPYSDSNNIAIISHGGIIDIFVFELLKLFNYSLDKNSLFTTNTGLYTFEITRKKEPQEIQESFYRSYGQSSLNLDFDFKGLLFNDSQHLKNLI